MGKAKIVFTPSGVRGEVAVGTDVLTAARELGADLDTVCGGIGVCGRCKVRVSYGDFPKYQIQFDASHLNKAGATEHQVLGEKAVEDGERLGCHARVLGDAIIDIPPESQVHQQVVRKAAAEIELEAKPAVELVTTEVAEPKLNMPSGDLERLFDALEFETGYTDLRCAPEVLPSLQSTLKQGAWQVTAAIYNRRTVIALFPGAEKEACGLAVDIGSTTIAGHLCRLSDGKVLASSGLMNPQIRFGEDLMSRVSYSMMNPGGDAEMTKAVREGINQLIDTLLNEAGTSRLCLLDGVFVGNPVMHHLFLGIDPVELGGAPFALATQKAVALPANALGLNMAPAAQSYILPCIAGHVGADAAAVVLAEAPYKQAATTLIIDVGTNAEIVLGNQEKLVAASSPTGPAFEGAQISHGQRAAPGAIERVRIDPETREPRYQVIGIEPWSDEPGFAEAAAETGVTGICGSGIIEAIAALFLAGVIRADGVIDGTMAAQSARVKPDPQSGGKTFLYELVAADEPGGVISISQNDVRAIQLAKATLYASVKLLMDKLKLEKIERIRFAGAFGAHIDPRYAMILGMIPDCELDQVRAVGNAAGTGARIALMSVAARAEIEAEVQRLEKIETATEPNFQDYFVGAMAIPHKTDAFPHLSQQIQLPEPSAEDTGDSGQRGRRNRRRRARRSP